MANAGSLGRHDHLAAARDFTFVCACVCVCMCVHVCVCVHACVCAHSRAVTSISSELGLKQILRIIKFKSDNYKRIFLKQIYSIGSIYSNRAVINTLI